MNHQKADKPSVGKRRLNRKSLQYKKKTQKNVNRKKNTIYQ